MFVDVHLTMISSSFGLKESKIQEVNSVASPCIFQSSQHIVYLDPDLDIQYNLYRAEFIIYTCMIIMQTSEMIKPILSNILFKPIQEKKHFCMVKFVLVFVTNFFTF